MDGSSQEVKFVRKFVRKFVELFSCVTMVVASLVETVTATVVVSSGIFETSVKHYYIGTRLDENENINFVSSIILPPSISFSQCSFIICFWCVSFASIFIHVLGVLVEPILVLYWSKDTMF